MKLSKEDLIEAWNNMAFHKVFDQYMEPICKWTGKEWIMTYEFKEPVLNWLYEMGQKIEEAGD
jgi:hypothetical protein